MYNYDFESLADWIWNFRQTYEDNQEEGQKMFERIMHGDKYSMLNWPLYEELAVITLSTN